MTDTRLSRAIAQVVRSELAARRIDATDFAATLGQPKTTVWRKINGISRLSIDDVAAFAGALGWTVDKLLESAKALQESGAVFALEDGTVLVSRPSS